MKRISDRDIQKIWYKHPSSALRNKDGAKRAIAQYQLDDCIKCVEGLKEQIAEFVNEAKYPDGSSIAWDYLTDCEKSIALDKADQIISLIKGE